MSRLIIHIVFSCMPNYNIIICYMLYQDFLIMNIFIIQHVSERQTAFFLNNCS